MQQNQTSRCPNCQIELGESLARCPHCGMALQQAQPSEAFTRIPLLDGFLGTLASMLLILTGIGTIGVIIAFLRLRTRYPYFCTGLAVGGALLILLILGIFLTCLGGIGR